MNGHKQSLEGKSRSDEMIRTREGIIGDLKKQIKQRENAIKLYKNQIETLRSETHRESSGDIYRPTAKQVLDGHWRLMRDYIKKYGMDELSWHLEGMYYDYAELLGDYENVKDEKEK